MTRLARRLREARASGRAALVCYLTAGDPSLTETADLVAAMADCGADAVELGVAFSDPLADGPTIQRSSQRALASGASLSGILELVHRIRERADVPLVLMTYHNPVLAYGRARFAQDARAAGVDATIQTDLPPEEAREWLSLSHDAGLATVFLVAPTSPPDRIAAAGRASTGFVYCVSRMGVTGASKEIAPEAADLIGRARAVAGCPVCVGFGVSTPEHVRTLAAAADGVVVGSALVAIVEQEPTPQARLAALRRTTSALAAATRA